MFGFAVGFTAAFIDATGNIAKRDRVLSLSNHTNNGFDFAYDNVIRHFTFRKVGGLRHFRVGRFGGSFYVSKRKQAIVGFQPHTEKFKSDCPLMAGTVFSPSGNTRAEYDASWQAYCRNMTANDW